MGIVSRIIEENHDALHIIVVNIHEHKSVSFDRYELIRFIDHPILGEWFNKPVLCLLINPCTLELVIFI